MYLTAGMVVSSRLAKSKGQPVISVDNGEFKEPQRLRLRKCHFKILRKSPNCGMG